MNRLLRSAFFRGSKVVNALPKPRPVQDAWSGWHNRMMIQLLPADRADDYWRDRDAPYRKDVIKAVTHCLKGRDRSSVLEVGSHVGVNLDMIAKAMPDTLFTFYAFDPKLEYVAYMRERMPGVEARAYSDADFLADDTLPPGEVDLSLVAGVLYYLPPKRARAVIAKMARVSRYVVVNENLTAQVETRSRFYAPAYYWHPYRRWLVEEGMTIEHCWLSEMDHHARNGILIASSA